MLFTHTLVLSAAKRRRLFLTIHRIMAVWSSADVYDALRKSHLLTQCRKSDLTRQQPPARWRRRASFGILLLIWELEPWLGLRHGRYIRTQCSLSPGVLWSINHTPNTFFPGPKLLLYTALILFERYQNRVGHSERAAIHIVHSQLYGELTLNIGMTSIVRTALRRNLSAHSIASS